jgi:hypothetical protein
MLVCWGSPEFGLIFLLAAFFGGVLVGVVVFFEGVHWLKLK